MVYNLGSCGRLKKPNRKSHWTGFTVQIINNYTIKYPLCWHFSIFTQSVYYDWATLCPVTCGCGSVRQYKDHCLSNLTLYKDCKSWSLSHQICAPPPLSSSSGHHYPQLSLWVRECISTHLFDCSMSPVWRDGTSHKVYYVVPHFNNISEQKLATKCFFSEVEVMFSVS